MEPGRDFAPAKRSWLGTKMYQFELTFGTYMLEPWERCLVHALYAFLFFVILHTLVDLLRP